MRAIVDAYMMREFSSKKATVSQRVKALNDAVDSARAEGVLFYINAYEEAASWDFPSQKSSLESRGIATGSFVKMLFPLSENRDLEEKLGSFVESVRRVHRDA